MHSFAVSAVSTTIASIQAPIETVTARKYFLKYKKINIVE